MYAIRSAEIPAASPLRLECVIALCVRSVKLVRLGTLLVSAGVEISARLLLTPANRRAGVRAMWLRKTCCRLLALLDVTVKKHGRPPTSGLLVSNHLSYLDIIVLGAQQPMAFVSKREVRSWPLIGWLTTLAGTVYVNREQHRDVTRAGAQLCARASEGTVVCLFPEGTSSDGQRVLPFRAPLLQPAIDRGWQVTPAHLSYALRDGSVSDEVCYWRDMSFPTHLWNLLGKSSLTARVIYGGAHPPASDRKRLATALHESVRQLAGGTSAAAIPSEV